MLVLSRTDGTLQEKRVYTHETRPISTKLSVRPALERFMSPLLRSTTVGTYPQGKASTTATASGRMRSIRPIERNSQPFKGNTLLKASLSRTLPAAASHGQLLACLPRENPRGFQCSRMSMLEAKRRRSGQLQDMEGCCRDRCRTSSENFTIWSV